MTATRHRPTSYASRLFAGTALLGSLLAASAQTAGAAGCAATETMRGGRNNYVPNAPVVSDLGRGFTVSGTVRKAGTCEPAAGVRVQIWASTERGGESEASNRGSVMTGADGSFRLEMSQVVPNFGQPHIHMAYDDGAYDTLFLRPLLESSSDTSINVDFNLAPAAGNDAAGS